MIDARHVADQDIIQTEVCIVGSGPAGLTLAQEFAGQDFRVCLLESGGLELPDEQTAALAEVENTGDFDQVFPDRRNRRFGGNSTYWGVQIGNGQIGLRHRPLDEVDFEQRDWMPHSGWPFDRNHLMPYYERAHQVCQMGAFAYDAADWADAESPPLPFQGDRVTTHMFQFSRGDVFYEGSRQAIDQARNITTYLHANVVELETNETAQTVTRVKVACLNGKQFWVSAKVVVLAAGGVENTHLLLLSNQVQQQGLGNNYDRVGRFFMDHPLVHGGIIIPADRQIFNRTALYDMRRVNGTPIMGGLALTDEVIRREQLLNLAAWIFPRSRRFRSSKATDSLKELLKLRAFKAGAQKTLEHLGNVVSGLDDIGASIYDKVTRKPLPFWSNLSTGGWSHLQDKKDKVYGVFEVLHIAEQAPHADNRIVLSDRRDPLGRRRVQMQTHWHAEDIAQFKRGQEVLAEEIARAGLGRFVIERDENDMPILDTGGASHHMGTTRMHVDPKLGVVDPECRVHGVSNLYIASSSVFPTGGYANPTLTIIALAIRVADRVKQQMAEACVLSNAATIAAGR